jgi:hypothetical protein
MTDLGVVRFVRIIIWKYTDRNTAREAVDGFAATGARHNSRSLNFARPGIILQASSLERIRSLRK